MNGVLNTAATQKENPLLTKIAQEAEAQVPKALQGQFLSIMVAGGKLMWSPEMASERQAFDQAIQTDGEVPAAVAHTVLKICSIVQNESRSQQPLDAIGIAAPIFMAHVLQYVEAKHGIPVTAELIGQTAQLLQMNLMKMYGITEQHLQELIRQRSHPQGAQPGMDHKPDGDAAVPAGAADEELPEEGA